MVHAVDVRVVVRTVSFGAADSMLTVFGLQEVRMVLLFFPAVRIGTHVLIWAPLYVARNEITRFPLGAHFGRVREHRRPASIILPVVCIDANFAIVIIFSIWTPHRLEMIHVEVHVNIIQFDHIDGKFGG